MLSRQEFFEGEAVKEGGKQQGLGMIACCVVSLIVALSLLEPIFAGKFYFIDDHEFVNFLRSYQSTGSYWTVLFENTELGQLNFGRYRPIYYMVRLLTTLFFGLTPAYYFYLNFFLFWIAASSFGLTIYRFFSLPVAFLGICAFAALPAQQDLYWRLGPGENYALAGICLFAFAVAWLRDRPYLLWPVLSASSLLAIGSKENFCILILPLLFMLWHQWKKRCAVLWACVWTLPSLGVCLLVVVIIARKVLAPDTMDIYAVPMPLLDRLLYTWQHLTLVSKASLFASLMVFGGVLCGISRFSFLQRQELQIVSLLLLYIAADIVWNVIFYAGNIPVNLRYSIPVMLYWIVLPLLFLFILKNLAPVHIVATNGLFKQVGTLCLVAGCLFTAFGIQKTRTIIKERIADTRKAAAHVREVVSRECDKVVYFPLSSMAITEPIVAISAFVSEQATKKIFVYPALAWERSSLEKQLADSVVANYSKDLPDLLDDTVCLFKQVSTVEYRQLVPFSRAVSLENTLFSSGIAGERRFTEQSAFIGVGKNPQSKSARLFLSFEKQSGPVAVSIGEHALGVCQPGGQCELVVPPLLIEKEAQLPQAITIRLDLPSAWNKMKLQDFMWVWE